MAVFSVDSDAVESATAQVRGMSDRVRADVAAMLAVLNQLQDVWQGGASAAFQQEAADWRSTQALVDQRLDSINNALAAAARTYADTESAAMGMFR